MKNSTKALLAFLVCALIIVAFSVTMLLRNNGQYVPPAWSQNVDSTSATDAPTSVVVGATNNINGVRVTSKTIGGVPLLEYTNGTGTAQPVAIFMHGLSGDKTIFEPLALQLAAQGILVLCPDAYGHGERKSDPAISVLEMALETGRDIDKYLPYYDESAEADTSKLAVVGFSLGGFAAYNYAANGNTVPDLVITLCASPDWEEMVGRPVIYTTYGNQKSTTVRNDAERAKIDTFLKENTPLDILKTKTEIRFKMMFGAKDDLVPYDGGQTLYDILEVTAPGMATFELDEQMGHSINEAQIVEIYDCVLEVLNAK